MKTNAVLLLTVLLWCQAHTIMSQNVSARESALAGGMNQFTSKLYKILSADSGNNNLVVSPFSVHAVVSMLALGLGGDTEKQVTQALHLPGTRCDWTQGYKSIFSTLQATQDVVLEIANKIYVQSGFHMKEEFKNDTEEYFSSVTEEVDIAGNPEEVRVSVNNWAAENTHDKIKDLLAPGSLNADVIMILLNAIYFKGMWKTEFKKEHTSILPFYLSSGSQKYAATMELTADFPYTELYDPNVQILKLPYKGGKFSMLILLPQERNGLSTLESKLDQLDVLQIIRRMHSVQVHVRMPKFKILSTIDLKESLIQAGLGALFTGGDFSGVSDQDITVSKALQKAFIEVNEEGTEAAAVTALLITLTSGGASRGPQQFFADHPFIMMIVEEEMGTILFMARVLDPGE